MLGIIRFFLASCVVAFHLTAQIPVIGNFAVNFFYVISGFLITLILNTTYQFNFAKFWQNRTLRLLPAYLFFVVIGCGIIFFIPTAHEFHSNWTGKFLPGDWLGNAFIFPWAFLSDHSVPSPFSAFTGNYIFDFDGSRFRIVTSSWSVGVEITCYFLLWLFIARSKITCIASLILSIAYQVYAFNTYHSFDMIYFPFLAAALPFSMGAAGYFIYENLPSLAKDSKYTAPVTFACIAVFIVNWYAYKSNAFGEQNILLYYLNNIIAVITTISLVKLPTPTNLKFISKWLGDLAYPIFLCQYFGGFFAWLILGGDKRGWAIFLLGYPISIILGILCIILVDRPLVRVRANIRTQAIKTATQENSSI